MAHSQARQPVSIPDSMASMGDSITAGAIANYKRQWGMNPLVSLALVTQIASAFLSHSISPLEIRKLSWSGGVDPRHRMTSHAARLEFMSQYRKLRHFNAARSGDESADLAAQLEDIKNWAHEENRDQFPEYITLLIGPNDICADSVDEMVTPDIFELNIKDTVEEIQKTNPYTKVLISTVPNVEQLRKVAKDARLMGFGPFAKCEDFWRIAKTCPTLTTISDPMDRARISMRVQEFNAAINHVVGFHHTNYGEDKIRAVNSIYNSDFSADDLSLDCFHPNYDGQNLISEKTWNASWWGADWRDFHAENYRKHIEAKQKREQDRKRRARRRK